MDNKDYDIVIPIITEINKGFIDTIDNKDVTESMDKLLRQLQQDHLLCLDREIDAKMNLLTDRILGSKVI